MKQRFYNITDISNKKRGTAIFCAIALVIALAGCAVSATAPEQTGREGSAMAAPQSGKDKTQVQVEITEQQPGFYSIRTEPRSGESDEIAVTYTPANPQSGDFDGLSAVIGGTKTQSANSEETDRIYELIEWSANPYSGGEMAWPIPGNTGIIASFGKNPKMADDIHTGIDVAGDFGADIIAANDGTVIKASREWKRGVGYGMYVIIDHGGEISTLYAHCSEILVSEGDSVVKGEKIAEAGATGFASETHLHFEVRLSGAAVDPMPYITSTGFIWPVRDGGFISSGLDTYPGHTGIDIAGLPEGTPVYAAAAGTVVSSVNSNVGYGKHIIIDHGNGYQTLYAHNSELYANVGDIVAQGQTIAALGRSGNTTGHQLHLEIRHNGKILDPEDFLTAPSGFDLLDDGGN